MSTSDKVQAAYRELEGDKVARLECGPGVYHVIRQEVADENWPDSMLNRIGLIEPWKPSPPWLPLWMRHPEIPLYVMEALPAEAWRFVDHKGAVLAEGRL